MTDDYKAFAADAPSQEALAGLSKAAVDLYEAELEVTKAEMALKQAQQRVQDISERIIPSLMDEAGVKELRLKNGTRLTVEEVLQLGSVTKNPEVLDWLERTGHGGKVKRTVSVSLGRDAEEGAEEAMSLLRGAGFEDIQAVRWVEAPTLKAHVKGVLEGGGEIDLDLLGVRQFKRAKVKGKPEGSPFGEE